MGMSKTEAQHRVKILDTLRQIPHGIPAGWTKNTLAVGGLSYIGFSETAPGKLVCISGQAQSLIDCETGAVQFCDVLYDEDALFAYCAPLGDEPIRLAGTGGGGLRLWSSQGESLTAVFPDYPKSQLVYAPGFRSPFLSPGECNVIWDDYEPLAFGFSPCSRYMAAACPSDLTIWKRD